MNMVNMKTKLIIGLLIALYSFALITQRHFYPIVAFNMFNQKHNESDGVVYVPYVITKNGDFLINENFDSWPMRRADLHQTVETWISQNTADAHLSQLTPFMLNLMQQYYSYSTSPKHRYMCYGVMRLRWPLSVPPAQRRQATESIKLAEHCDAE